MNGLSIVAMVAPRVSPEPQAPATPAAAIARSWVDGAPRKAQPYLRLMRLDRPIGTWLLFLPCVFGLALGAAYQSRGFGTWADVTLVGLFGIGSVVMRGAGCTFNDIVDRDIDAAVARTRGRPIPSGAVSVTAAFVFLAAQCALGLGILLTLNLFSVMLGASSLILIAVYPFMKRITWWPQAWLGLTFNWGALLGFAAITGTLAMPALLLYASCFFWTLGYDTIYAHQDKDDDALIGVRSTARLFGDRSRTWIGGFYLLTFVLSAAAMGSALARPFVPLALLIPAGAQFVWQVRTLDIASPTKCDKLFRSNRDAGLLIAVAVIASSHLVS
jgi:4-hydroxybenzoate polyprenyltransferase